MTFRLSRFLSRLSCTAWLAASPWACAQEADEWPYVRVRCDAQAATVSVSWETAREERAIPREDGVVGLDAMYRLNEQDPADPVLVPRSTFVRSCVLGRANYRVLVEPYKFNLRVQGMCGAAQSSAAITISRNGVALLRHLVLNVNCFADAGFETSIDRLSLSEATGQAGFFVSDAAGKRLRVVPLSGLPKMTRAQLVQPQD